MRLWTRSATLPRMDTKPGVTVVVELKRTSATISGQTSIDGAAATEFFGWLELIDRLERAAGSRLDGSPPISPVPTPSRDRAHDC